MYAFSLEMLFAYYSFLRKLRGMMIERGEEEQEKTLQFFAE